MKLGHVCHAKLPSGASPGLPMPKLDRPLLVPAVYVPLAGPAAMFCAINSLHDPDSAHSSATSGHASTADRAWSPVPGAGKAVVQVMSTVNPPPVPNPHALVGTAVTEASPVQRLAPVDVRTHGVDSPSFDRHPTQQEEEACAHMVLLLKKSPVVRQEFAAA